MVLTYGLNINELIAVHYGFGRHQLMLSLDYISKFLLNDWTIQIIFACAISATRLSLLVFYHRTIVPAGIWIVVECNIGIASVCLPLMRPLISLDLLTLINNLSFSKGRQTPSPFIDEEAPTSGLRSFGKIWNEKPYDGPRPSLTHQGHKYRHISQCQHQQPKSMERREQNCNTPGSEAKDLRDNSKSSLYEPTSLKTKTVINKPSKPIYNKSPTPLNASTSTKAETIFYIETKAHFLSTYKTITLDTCSNVPNEPLSNYICKTPRNESASPQAALISHIENEPLLHFTNIEAPAPGPLPPRSPTTTTTIKTQTTHQPFSHTTLKNAHKSPSLGRRNE
ncbi:MAG: hypothetical protein Q9209_003206 [Squamulea sp. 1 TL-2023]